METESDPFELPDFENEWINKLKTTGLVIEFLRVITNNIKKEQYTQKKIFDRKVKRSR